MVYVFSYIRDGKLQTVIFKVTDLDPDLEMILKPLFYKFRVTTQWEITGFTGNHTFCPKILGLSCFGEKILFNFVFPKTIFRNKRDKEWSFTVFSVVVSLEIFFGVGYIPVLDLSERVCYLSFGAKFLKIIQKKKII